MYYDTCEFEQIIPTDEQLSFLEGGWVKSATQYRDATQRYENGKFRKVELLGLGRGTIYFTEKTFIYDGQTLVINADDFPFIPTNSLAEICTHPSCGGRKGIHGSIITNHTFKKPVVDWEKRGRAIRVPYKAVNVLAHGKHMSWNDHKAQRCRCLPQKDIRVENKRDADIIRYV